MRSPISVNWSFSLKNRLLFSLELLVLEQYWNLVFRLFTFRFNFPQIIVRINLTLFWMSLLGLVTDGVRGQKGPPS